MNYTKEKILSKMQPEVRPEMVEINFLSSNTFMEKLIKQKKSSWNFSNGAALSLIEEPDNIYSFNQTNSNTDETLYEFMMITSFYQLFIPVSFKNDAIQELYEDPKRYCSIEKLINFLDLVNSTKPYINSEHKKMWFEIQQILEAVEKNDINEFVHLTNTYDLNIQLLTQNLSNQQVIENFFHISENNPFIESNNIKKEIFYAELLVRALDNQSFDIIESINEKISPSFKEFFFSTFIENRQIYERVASTILQSPDYFDLLKFLKDKNIYDVSPYINSLTENFSQMKTLPWFEKLLLEFNIDDTGVNKKVKNKL